MRLSVLFVLVVAIVLLTGVECKRKKKKNRDEDRQEESVSVDTQQNNQNTNAEENESERNSDGERRSREGAVESSSEEEEEEEEETTVAPTAASVRRRIRRGRSRISRGRSRTRRGRGGNRGGGGNEARGGGGGGRGGGRKSKKTKVNVKAERNSRKSRVGFGDKPERIHRPRRRKITGDQKRQMLSKCRGRSCKKQSDKSKQRKEDGQNLRRKAKKDRMKNKSGRQSLSTDEERAVDDQVELEIRKTFDAKKALLKAQGFSPDEVEPADDGVWGGDTLLTVEQAERIVLQQEAAVDSDFVPTPPPPPSGRRRRRSRRGRGKRYALYFEENEAAFWDVADGPIKYVIDTDFTTPERNIVKDALFDIESKTCINFLEIQTEPTDEPYIKYVKENYASFCGLSYLGRTGDENTVWLNMAECYDQMKGTAAHETMHALGVDHQQTRYDRSSYIDIKYSNIDAQNYDYFEAGDVTSMSGYGVPYDYFSVMHYNGYVAATDPTTPSMRAVKEPMDFFTEVMGQRNAISDKDGELLRRIYCSDDCVDLEVFCGWWATDNLCVTNTKAMIEYCPKSCGFCPLAASKKANLILQSRTG